jgi:hypothetical protein
MAVFSKGSGVSVPRLEMIKACGSNVTDKERTAIADEMVHVQGVFYRKPLMDYGNASFSPLLTGYEVRLFVNSYAPRSVTFCNISLTLILNT